MITYEHIRAEVEATLPAVNNPDGADIDIDAVVCELIHRFGLISINSRTTAGAPVIDPDTYWDVVRRYDATEI